MSKLLTKVRTTITEAFTNTPVEVLITILCGLLVSAQIQELTTLSSELFGTVLMTAVLAVTTMFATSAGHALKIFDGRTRWLLTGVLAAGFAAYGGAVLNLDHTTELWRWAFLAIATLMGVMLVPVAAKIGNVSASERFWRYNIRLFSRVVVAYAYGFLLYAGLSIGLLAIDGLFDISVSGETYGHLFTWVAAVLGTILAIGSLAEVKRIGHAFTPETLVWSGRLGTFLFMPLVLLYLTIMYVYLGKVLLTGELPSNILSPLALGAGMLGYLGLFVLQPHMHREDFKPLATVLRAFPAAFVPIVPFGIYAVAERIGQYGWTEFRYARMAALVSLGVFSVIGATKWLRKREFSLVTGPAILGTVALLGAVGPWGVSNVSHVSQSQRLTAALTNAQLMGADGKMLPKEQMESAPLTTAGSTIYEASEYLLEAHGDEALEAFSAVKLPQGGHKWEKLAALGIGRFGTILSTLNLDAGWDAPYELDRGGIATEFGVSNYGDTTTRGVNFELSKSVLTVSYKDKRGQATLDFSHHVGPFSVASKPLDDSERSVPIVHDGREVGVLRLNTVNLEYHNGQTQLTHVAGLVLLY